MAIYLVGPATAAKVVRARNGNIACELYGDANADVVRVTEDGPDGIISAVLVPVAEEQASPAFDDGESREQEITSISDRVRRFQNKDTGEVRTEPFDT